MEIGEDGTRTFLPIDEAILMLDSP